MHFPRHMGRFVVTLSALAMLLTACGGSSSTTTKGSSTTGNGDGGSTSNCVSGTEMINDINTRSFCGTATAQLTINGQQYNFTKGECFNINGAIGINAGRIILDTSSSAAGDALKKQNVYLGIELAAPADGTFDQGAISGNYLDQVTFTIVKPTFVISGNLTKGTFTGKDLLTSADASGSWSCS